MILHALSAAWLTVSIGAGASILRRHEIPSPWPAIWWVLGVALSAGVWV